MKRIKIFVVTKKDDVKKGTKKGQVNITFVYTMSHNYFDCVEDIYDNNAKYEILYGSITNRSSILYKDINDTTYKVKTNVFDSNHYPEAHQIDIEKSLNNGMVIEKENSVSFIENEEIYQKMLNRTATEEEINSLAIIPLSPKVATRIVLSIYFEGWDRDNLNETMGASFISKLSFGTFDKNIL